MSERIQPVARREEWAANLSEEQRQLPAERLFHAEDLALLEQAGIPSAWLDRRPGMRERWASLAARVAVLVIRGEAPPP